MRRVVIAGVSTRAAADSAARAGFGVTAIDAYADRDQHPGVHAIALPRDRGLPFSPAHAASVAAAITADAAAYLSNFDNDPDAVAALGTGRVLWGNPAAVLRRVRDPFVVARAFRHHGVVVPALASGPGDASEATEWLLKPLSSGGGHGIRRWRHGERVPAETYLQERVEGSSGSVVFVAAGGRAVPLAISRQLIGDAAFGSKGYRYAGSILAPPGDASATADRPLVRSATHLCEIAAGEFSLVGVNGIDFIGHHGVARPVEINPRWSASMELVERAHAVNVFALHAAACRDGSLPAAPGPPPRAFGKAIVFAREPAVAAETDRWLSDPDRRDIPHAGESFSPGQPVCTVFAAAPDAARCYERLVACAERVYRDLDRRTSLPARADHDSPSSLHESE